MSTQHPNDSIKSSKQIDMSFSLYPQQLAAIELHALGFNSDMSFALRRIIDDWTRFTAGDAVAPARHTGGEMSSVSFEMVGPGIVRITSQFREPFNVNREYLLTAIHTITTGRGGYMTDVAYQDLKIYKLALAYLDK